MQQNKNNKRKKKIKYLPDFSIGVGPKRVDVRSDGASEKSGLLRDDAELAPEIPEPNCADIPAIDQNSSGGGVHQPKKSAQQSCLPAASSPHHPHLLSCSKCACDALQYIRCVFSVLHLFIVLQGKDDDNKMLLPKCWVLETKSV